MPQAKRKESRSLTAMLNVHTKRTYLRTRMKGMAGMTVMTLSSKSGHHPHYTYVMAAA